MTVEIYSANLRLKDDVERLQNWVNSLLKTPNTSITWLQSETQGSTTLTAIVSADAR